MAASAATAQGLAGRQAAHRDTRRREHTAANGGKERLCPWRGCKELCSLRQLCRPEGALTQKQGRIVNIIANIFSVAQTGIKRSARLKNILIML